MFWTPKCCSSQTQSPDIDKYLNNFIEFYSDEKTNKTTTNGISNNTSQAIKVLDSSICGKGYVKNRSTAAQDTAIQEAINPNTSIEVIFKYFDFEPYKITKFTWGGSTYIFKAKQPLARISLNGKSFIAEDQFPFISIIGVLQK